MSEKGKENLEAIKGLLIGMQLSAGKLELGHHRSMEGIIELKGRIHDTITKINKLVKKEEAWLRKHTESNC